MWKHQVHDDQNMLHIRAGMPQQEQQLVEDIAEENFPLQECGVWMSPYQNCYTFKGIAPCRKRMRKEEQQRKTHTTPYSARCLTEKIQSKIHQLKGERGAWTKVKLGKDKGKVFS